MFFGFSQQYFVIFGVQVLYFFVKMFLVFFFNAIVDGIVCLILFSKIFGAGVQKCHFF